MTETQEKINNIKYKSIRNKKEINIRIREIFRYIKRKEEEERKNKKHIKSTIRKRKIEIKIIESIKRNNNKLF